MICITICDFGYDACRHALRRCERYLHTYPELVVEIRLDLCGLNEEETQRLFCDSKVPLIATCRRRSSDLYLPAVLSGASYIDIDGIQSDTDIKHIFQELKGHKVQKILSYQNFQKTPSLNELISYFKNGISLGADIIKITATAQNTEDTEKLLSLYSLQREGQLDDKVRLVINAMGYAGAYASVEAYFMGAPFLYCTLNERNKLYPGMLDVEAYGKLRLNDIVKGEVSIPGSKDITQKAIVAALLSNGENVLRNFSPCRDTEAALSLARNRGRRVSLKGSELTIVGHGLKGRSQPESNSSGYLSSLKNMLSGASGNASFHEDTCFVGESGLLARLCIPIASQLGHNITVSGEGNLLEREMTGSRDAIEQFGASCILTSDDTLPAIINGPLSGGSATVSAKEGTQTISGLVMALPLSKKDSVLEIVDLKSKSNLFQTIGIIRNFGINISCTEEDGKMVCNIPGQQKYSPTVMELEGDWSTAANFVVAAAIFGSLKLTGLNPKSAQADRAIIDLVKKIGASVHIGRKYIEIKRGHLTAFEYDVTNNPDLFPILTVLASYCEGTSVISGLQNVKFRQIRRIETICSELRKMGVALSLSENEVSIKGMCITRRIIGDSLLHGVDVITNGDHRVAMALKIAGIYTQDKLSVDDMDCVEKSYPLFRDTLNSITKRK